MPTTVDIPNVGSVEFPDEMGPDEIKSAISEKIIKPRMQRFNDALTKADQLSKPNTGQVSTIAGGPRVPVADFSETMADIKPQFGEDVAHPGVLTQMGLEKPFEPNEGESSTLTYGKEAANILLGIPDFLTSSAGVGATAAGTLAPATTAAFFTGDMLHSLGQQVKQHYANWDKMTPTEKRVALTDDIGTGTFALLAGFGAKKGMDVAQGKTTPAGKVAAEISKSEPTLLDVEQAAMQGVKPKVLDVTPKEPTPEKPVVPETPPEENKGVNVLEEIKQKGARTIADIQRLYPMSQLSREQARVLRDQAWGKQEQPVPKTEPSEKVSTPAPEPIAVEQPNSVPKVAIEEKTSTEESNAGEQASKAVSQPAEPPVSLAPENKPETKPAEPVATPSTANPQVETKPVQQTFVGMGGATPSEFDPVVTGPSSIRYKQIDAERQKRGLEPLTKPESVSDQAVLDKANAAYDNDPSIGQKTVDNVLSGKNKTLDDTQNRILHLEWIGIRDQYYKSAREAAQAYDDGRLDDMQEANVRTAEWAEKLARVEEANRIAASVQGRTLRSRRVMLNEDMTLASMEMQKRAAKGGAPLTPDERAHLQKLADDYKAKLDAYEKHQTEREAKVRDDAFKEAFAKVSSEKTPQYHPKVLEKAEQIITKMESTAKGYLKDVLGATWSPTPEVLGKMAFIGATKLARGVLELSKWTDEMVKDIGEKFRPYAKQVFDLANQELDKQLADVGPGARKVVKAKLTADEERAAITERIKSIVNDDKKGDLTTQLQKLARNLYQSGIKDREAMVDALHDAVGGDDTMSRRDVADAFAGYGDFKQLSKDQITVALRGMKGELQQIAKLEDMAAGKPPLKSGLERRVPSDAERDLIKKVNDAKFKFQIPVENPSTQLKSALDTLKTTLANRIKDYEQRLKERDFAARPRRELQLDNTAIKLKADYERVKKAWDEEKRKDELARRQTWQKAADKFVRWERAFKLSSPTVFGKLSAAALTRFGTTAAEEGVGGVLSKIPGISKVAEKAPREGGVNAPAMAKAFTKAFTTGLRDAAQTAKKGAADIDVTYGGKLIDKDWANVFGQLHGMLKAPVKRAEFELSLQKRAEHAIRNGVDVTNPMVQSRLAAEALEDGYRSIFMQKGFASDFVNGIISMAERSKKAPVAGELTARTMRFLMPVVRVPLNIVGETATGIYGMPVASARTMFHAVKGTLNTLDPKTADAIMRQFKKGSIGLGLMAVGYFNSENIGGYYRPGARQKPDEPKFGGFRVGETDVPRWMTHAPWFELMQFGATLRRVKDEHEIKGKDDGITDGMWAAGLGLVDETPFVKEMVDLNKVRSSPNSRTAFFGELAKSTVSPQLLVKIAEATDKEDGEPVKRKPTSIIEHVEMGVPGLRQNVPESYR